MTLGERPRGAVYGFDVYAPFPFSTLRPPAGLPRLEVATQTVAPRSEGDTLVAEVAEPGFLARIFTDGETYRLWVDGVGWFDIDPRVPRIIAPPDVNSLDREELLLGVPALLCFLHHGDASLHAAAIDIGGEAVLLVAPQAHGKSTLAAAFAQRGYRVLSEDVSCIRLADPPRVVPGPRSLRLRDDVARRFELPMARTLHRRPDRTRYVFADRASDPLPIRTLVLLRQSSGAIRIEATEPMRSLPDLWQASFRLTRTLERRCFASIATLANAVPVVELHRPLVIEALGPTVEAVLEACGAAEPAYA
jgi:hypothetical protein